MYLGFCLVRLNRYDDAEKVGAGGARKRQSVANGPYYLGGIYWKGRTIRKPSKRWKLTCD